MVRYEQQVSNSARRNSPNHIFVLLVKFALIHFCLLSRASASKINRRDGMFEGKISTIIMTAGAVYVGERKKRVALALSVCPNSVYTTKEYPTDQEC